MRGRSIHVRALLVLAVVVAAVSTTLVLGLGSAVAANPNAPCNSPAARVISCHFSGAFVDDDFCGTGRTVDVSFDGHFTASAVFDPNSTFNNSEGWNTLTNPATGAAVMIHSAYRFTGTLLSGDPNDVHIVQWVFKGGPEVIHVPNGGVIARDAGNLVVIATFNGDDLVGTQITSDSGSHELFANGDCGVLAQALGV
jgi:hypothetical protein